jgi:ribosome-associated translation inhibitor RaiA
MRAIGVCCVSKAFRTSHDAGKYAAPFGTVPDTGKAYMTGTSGDSTVVSQRLRLATGFHVSERDWISERLAALGARLRSFPDAQIDLEISLKDRDGADQRVTLECWIRRATRLHLVSTSSAQELAVALNEVRTSMIRQIDDAKTRTEPRNNRALRHPDTAQEPPG